MAQSDHWWSLFTALQQNRTPRVTDQHPGLPGILATDPAVVERACLKARLFSGAADAMLSALHRIGFDYNNHPEVFLRTEIRRERDLYAAAMTPATKLADTLEKILDQFKRTDRGPSLYSLNALHGRKNSSLLVADFIQLSDLQSKLSKFIRKADSFVQKQAPLRPLREYCIQEMALVFTAFSPKQPTSTITGLFGQLCESLIIDTSMQDGLEDALKRTLRKMKAAGNKRFIDPAGLTAQEAKHGPSWTWRAPSEGLPKLRKHLLGHFRIK